MCCNDLNMEACVCVMVKILEMERGRKTPAIKKAFKRPISTTPLASCPLRKQGKGESLAKEIAQG